LGLKGPVSKGLSSDDNSRKLDDGQPQNAPYDIEIMFTERDSWNRILIR